MYIASTKFNFFVKDIRNKREPRPKICLRIGLVRRNAVCAEERGVCILSVVFLVSLWKQVEISPYI